MKILFVIDTLEMGGAEKSLLEFLSRPRGFEAVVCTIYRGDALKADLERSNNRVISLNFPGPYNFRAVIRRMRGVLAEERPDIVHATLLRSDLVMRWCCYRAGIPLAVHLVGDSFNPYRWSSQSFSWRAKAYFFLLLNKLTTRRVNLFIAVTELVKANFERALKVLPTKVKVIYRGRSVSTLKEGVRPLSREGVTLINVGRLTKSKGQILLVDVVAELKKTYARPMVLQIIGEGHEYKNLAARVQALGVEKEVQLLGFRDDVPQLLQESDIFLFPSFYEGAAGAVIEAMLTGRPVIASDIDAFREYVKHGQNGLLFRAGDVGDLLQQINVLLKAPAEAVRLGAAARRFGLEHFDIEKRNTELEQTLMGLKRN